jgi:hypothetical protein
MSTASNVTIIPAKAQTEINRDKYHQLRVAAYCRVSTEQEDQQNSYQVQIAYYTDWFCQYHLTHFIRTRIMQRERYDHSRAFFELPEAAHRWRCRFFC